MEKTYDFRIDSATMEAALEKYRELESVLEEELEALQTGIPEGSLEWAGAGQEALVEGMHTFLSEGGYAITYDLVSKLCECMEEALLQIYSLQSRCEGFVDQFSADEYTEPETPIEGKSYNGGILSINYNEGSQIGDLCDSISEEGNLFRNEVYEILSGCSDLLGEMSEDMERLDAARDKLDRVLNYKDSWSLYKTGMSSLEFDMNVRLKAIAGETEEGAAGGLFVLSEAGGVVERTDICTDVEKIKAELLSQTDGVYGFEELLGKDAEDISPAEWEALAQIYEESLGHHTEENREIQERYLESLFSEGTEEEKVSRIKEYLPEKETAYYTLQRMENVCLPEGSGEKYKIEVISREGQQVYEIKSVMADTLVEVTPLDLDNLVEEYLDTKTDPPYSREELEAWIDKVGNDEEWRLTGNLIRGEYREAFGALPEDISPVIMDELLLYEDKVFEQGNPDSMEDFLNGMLYYNRSCCNYEGELPYAESVDNGRKYMSILMSTRMAELDAIENYDEVPEECYRIFLYHSLFNDHTRFDGVASGDGYLSISNLQRDAYGYYSYHVDVEPKEHIIYFGEERIKEVRASGEVYTSEYEPGEIEITWDTAYADKVFYQMLGGAYYDDATLVGIIGEIILSLTPMDVVCDFRDMCAYITKICKGQHSLENYGMAFVCFASIFVITADAFSIWKKVKKLNQTEVNILMASTKLDGITEESIETGIKHADEVLEGGLDILSTPSSRVLRQNLIEAGVEVPDYPHAAHHIVAGNSPKAAEARAILQRYGVDINDAANGTFLPTARGVAEGAYHPSLHTDSYYRKVTELLSSATCKDDVLDILDDIAEQLQNGTF